MIDEPPCGCFGNGRTLEVLVGLTWPYGNPVSFCAPREWDSDVEPAGPAEFRFCFGTVELVVDWECFEDIALDDECGCCGFKAVKLDVGTCFGIELLVGGLVRPDIEW